MSAQLNPMCDPMHVGSMFLPHGAWSSLYDGSKDPGVQKSLALAAAALVQEQRLANLLAMLPLLEGQPRELVWYQVRRLMGWRNFEDWEIAQFEGARHPGEVRTHPAE